MPKGIPEYSKTASSYKCQELFCSSGQQHLPVSFQQIKFCYIIFTANMVYTFLNRKERITVWFPDLCTLQKYVQNQSESSDLSARRHSKVHELRLWSAMPFYNMQFTCFCKWRRLSGFTLYTCCFIGGESPTSM